VGFVRLSVERPGVNDQLEKTLAALDEIQEIHYITGEDGYLLKVRVSGPAELERLVRETIGCIRGVKATGTSIVLTTIKETARIPIDDRDLETGCSTIAGKHN
jgi:Lrp/AsnC family leucine-responsive transcriptional regulator